MQADYTDGKKLDQSNCREDSADLSAKGTLREQPMLERAWGGRGVLGGGGGGGGWEELRSLSPQATNHCFFFFQF